MAEKSLEKYVNAGFNVITDDHQRAQAQQRCVTLDLYYREKVDLVINGKNTEGSQKIGFFIKALQEDWQNPKAVKEQQDKDHDKKRFNVQKRLKELEKAKESLKKQIDAAKSAIYEEIIQEETIFTPIFESAKAGVTAFRETIFPYDMSAEACFRKGGMSRNLIAVKMEESFPDRFKAINDNFKVQLLMIETEVEELKTQ